MSLNICWVGTDPLHVCLYIYCFIWYFQELTKLWLIVVDLNVLSTSNDREKTNAWLYTHIDNLLILWFRIYDSTLIWVVNFYNKWFLWSNPMEMIPFYLSKNRKFFVAKIATLPLVTPTTFSGKSLANVPEW